MCKCLHLVAEICSTIQSNLSYFVKVVQLQKNRAAQNEENLRYMTTFVQLFAIHLHLHSGRASKVQRSIWLPNYLKSLHLIGQILQIVWMTKRIKANIWANHLRNFFFFCNMPIALAIFQLVINIWFIVQPFFIIILTAASLSSACESWTIGFLGTTRMWVGAWGAISGKATHWNTMDETNQECAVMFYTEIMQQHMWNCWIFAFIERDIKF